ncbi:MAG: RNA ligase family protein [Promethearchaeota archaeon]|jgi:RNA ligase (TIGR02306 family)
MSTHEIAIVQLDEIEPHPNPEVERMEITHIWGWQCCVGKGQFQPGSKAVYIPPDYLVPTDHPSFAFLKRADGKPKERIRVRRFKGALSQGLLITVPEGLAHLPVGTNVIEQLGIERYVPPIESAGENFIGGPSGLYTCKFDVESWQRWHTTFADGEPVYVTEKMHGTSARYTYAKNSDGEWNQFCGTRVNWMKEGSNPYWRAFKQCPGIGTWCEAHPELILYGEVFGLVKGFKYGAVDDTIFFAAFGVLNQNTWLNLEEARASVQEHGVQWVPLLFWSLCG